MHWQQCEQKEDKNGLAHQDWFVTALSGPLEGWCWAASLSSFAFRMLIAGWSGSVITYERERLFTLRQHLKE
eukprot:3799735-Amphidinium_carterae.1